MVIARVILCMLTLMLKTVIIENYKKVMLLRGHPISLPALSTEMSICHWFQLNPFLLFSCLYNSGYDFSYLLKALTATNLPSEETEFFELLRIYFPRIYDIKYLMKSCKDLKGGLQEVADILQVGTSDHRVFYPF